MDICIHVHGCEPAGDGANFALNAEAHLADGRNVGNLRVTVNPAQSASQTNSSLTQIAKDALTAVYGVTFGGGDRIVIIGGRV